MIIDTHTHWGIVWEDKYGTDPSEWLKVCDRNRVDISALMTHRGLTINSDMKRCNDILRETCDRSGGRLFPLATVRYPILASQVSENLNDVSMTSICAD